MKYFDCVNLPQNLQDVGRPFWYLACTLDANYPDGAEKSAGLRKLLEAKDCMVRAKLG